MECLPSEQMKKASSSTTLLSSHLMLEEYMIRHCTSGGKLVKGGWCKIATLPAEYTGDYAPRRPSNSSLDISPICTLSKARVAQVFGLGASVHDHAMMLSTPPGNCAT